MKNIFIFICVYFLIFISFINLSSSSLDNFTLVVHGGAGIGKRSGVSLEDEILKKEGVFRALKNGYEVLKENKENSHLDAVKSSIIVFEDDPNFNAGKGAKINQNFEVELDASIMDGSNKNCGAVAGLKTTKNPILAAEKIMNQTPHILLISSEADEFAKDHDLEQVENSYFFTRKNIDEWIKHHDKRQDEITEESMLKYLSLSKSNSNNLKTFINKSLSLFDMIKFIREIKKANNSFKKNNYSYLLKHKNVIDDNIVDLKGTVGAIALDLKGNIAAATSTGGTTYKLPGRVGDSPLIGAGTYANNDSIAASCSGTGEEMIRRVTAYDIHARFTYQNKKLDDVCNEIIKELPPNVGGFITLDKNGNVSVNFNTPGMARGYVRKDGIAFISIYDENIDYTPVKYDLNKDFKFQLNLSVEKK